MDLEDTWRQSGKQDELLNQLLQQTDFSGFPSRLPLKKLKRNLLNGMIWATLTTLAYVVLFFFIDVWQGRVALVVLISFNLRILSDSWKLYQKTPETITPSNSLKQELTLNYDRFHQWWALQQRISLFVYPIAAAGGFIIGGVWGSGKPVADFLYNARMLSLLCITVLILMPLCYFGARWMFNYAYGRHLKTLKALIDELN